MTESSHFILQSHLTERCNLHCSHCYQNDFNTLSSPELSFEQQSEILRQFVTFLERRRLRGQWTVTGGEPLLRDDFFDLLLARYKIRKRVRLAILTNGTLIDDETARRLQLQEPHYVQVSLDGIQETHDRVRGVGSFDAAIEGIRLLVKRRVPTVLSFTASRSNFHEFRDVAKLARILRVNRIWADRIITNGPESLAPTECRELFEQMRSVREEPGGSRRTEIAMHRALQFLVGGGEPYSCTAGKSILAVMPNGDVLPCRRLPKVVGNLTVTPLGELYESAPFLKQLREVPFPSDCGGCFYKKRCGGGLRCLANAAYGDPFCADPGCWLCQRDV